MRILVADDDSMIRMMLRFTLEGFGHEVVEADSGAAAWRQLATSEFPVLITDWSMPEMDGIELTEHVRRLPRRSYTYIIMLTSHGSREHYLTGVRAGVDAFLVKPLDATLLEAQLHIGARVVGWQEHTRRLESIVTVCSYCKRVRDDGEWVNMERYIATEYQALPSHTFCPSCFHEKVEPEMKALGLSTEDLGLA